MSVVGVARQGFMGVGIARAAAGEPVLPCGTARAPLDRCAAALGQELAGASGLRDHSPAAQA